MKSNIWSVRYYELFREVFEKGKAYYKIEIPTFNFEVKREANFRHFNLLRKCLDFDINNYYLRELKREPTEDEYYASVRLYFRKGFCYCYHWTYEAKITPIFNYTPLNLYNSYNKIISFKVIKENKNTFIKR